MSNCCSGQWAIVPKYSHVPDLNPVLDLFVTTPPPCFYTTTDGLLEECLVDEYRRKNIKNNYISKFDMSPNPVNNILYISNINEKMTFSIRDILGRIILEKYSEGSDLHIDMSSFLPGVYIVYTSNGDMEKVIRQ